MIKFQIRWWSMLIKLFFSVLLCVTLVTANESNSQEVEILAQSVSKTGTTVHAVGNVVLYSPKYLITADEAFYDYESADLELMGNITMLEGIHFASRSGHTKLNLNTDKGTSSQLFFFDETSNVWLKCENAIMNAERYITEKSIVSSCNTQDPDWKIAFSSGELDKENKWMHLYNPVFYAGEIPILYLPYFSFSTDTTRRTGLLKPDLGYGSEGLYYSQPIYFAPNENWDLEVTPQIRTQRGEGIHSKLRFVDSAYSKGEFSLGYFNEQAAYALDKELKNMQHYGYKLMYDRSALLSTKYDNLEDGLWIDINYLNDIDYYNTLSNETATYDKLVTSRVNYYAKRENDYVGFYSKYYIDTSKVSNDNTVQDLPTVHYHRFTNSLFIDNLLYSVDYKAKNYERTEGANAFQHEFNSPLTLYFSLLEDYLHVSVSENIYLSHISYSHEDTPGDYGQYVRNFHKFLFFTELAKPYDTFYHTMYLGLDHVVPSGESKDGYLIDFANFDTIEKSTTLNLKEFFYNTQAEKKISHKMQQVYYYSDSKYKYGDFDNEIKYHVSNQFSLGHKLSYSHEYDTISRNQASISYTDDLYTTTLRYTYEDETYEKSLEKKDYSYVTLYADTRYIPYYKLFASLDYDTDSEEFKSWNVGFKKSTKCWDYSLQYRDIKIPKLTSSSIDSVNRKGIMLQFNFYPIGNINHDFSTETEQKL